MTTGELIRKYRKEKKITLKELGTALNVTGSAMSRYELNQRIISREQLRIVSKVLEIPFDELLNQELNSAANKLIETFDTGEDFEKRRKEITEGLKNKETKTIAVSHRPGNVVSSITVAQTETPEIRIKKALEQLNYEGQQKAAERVEELVEVPKYRQTEEENK